MKNKRNSGVYFRSKNTETDKFDNIVFEDLSLEEQNKVMEGRDVKWLKLLARQLANALNNIGEEFDLFVD